MRSDPWELARVLYAALEAVDRGWKVDPSAPGNYVRIPMAIRRQATEALRHAPRHLSRLHRVDEHDLVVLTSEDLLALRDAVDLVLAHSVPMSDQAVMLRREAYEALATARRALVLLDEAQAATA